MIFLCPSSRNNVISRKNDTTARAERKLLFGWNIIYICKIVRMVVSSRVGLLISMCPSRTQAHSEYWTRFQLEDDGLRIFVKSITQRKESSAAVNISITNAPITRLGNAHDCPV